MSWCMLQDYLSFVSAMVKQTSLNLKSIRGLGVKKIAVTNFPPLGCLPPFTAKNTFQHCNENLNVLVNLHNTLLRQAVAKLNSEAEDSPFLILDLYASFMSIFEKKGHPLGKTSHGFLRIALPFEISLQFFSYLTLYFHKLHLNACIFYLCFFHLDPLIA